MDNEHPGAQIISEEGGETDQSPTLGNLFAALAKAQGQMKPARMDSSNPHFGHPYASLDSILESVRKPLADNELAVVQRTRQNGSGILMETTLGHSSGEWMRSTLKLLLASVGKVGDPITMQSLGSAITYARRYGLAAITGAVSDADDDGNAASASAKKESPARREPLTEGPVHMCPIHNVAYRRYTKQDTGEVWYSHKLEDKSWCNEGKVKDPTPKAPEKPAQPAQTGEPPTAGETPDAGRSGEPGDPIDAALDEHFGPADHAPEATGGATKPVTASNAPGQRDIAVNALDEDGFKSLTIEQMRKELLNFQKVDRDRFGRVKVALGLTNKVMSELTPDDCFKMAKALLSKA